jgi:hypothetical protein
MGKTVGGIGRVVKSGRGSEKIVGVVKYLNKMVRGKNFFPLCVFLNGIAIT